LCGNLNEKGHWEDRLRWEGNIKVDINERALEALSGLIWLRMGEVGVMLGISWVAETLDSEEGRFSMDLVS
jgi:hypothetical protein